MLSFVGRFCLWMLTVVVILSSPLPGAEETGSAATLAKEYDSKVFHFFNSIALIAIPGI